jgi:hypothetical protein
MSPAAHTPWFDPGVRPVHVGVYRRRWPGGPYACWDGERWRADAATPEVAAAHEAASRVQDAPWQGLADAPAVLCLTCRGHSVIDRGVDEETGADLISECPDC